MTLTLVLLGLILTEEEPVMDIPPDLVELALEWAACRRALTVLADLTDEERAEFALLAATTLLTP